MPRGVYVRTEEQKTILRENGKKYRFRKGHPNGFKKGHIPWDKGKKRPEITGKNHFNWNGGRRIDKDGYVLIHNPEHPFHDKNNNALEHRLVVEKHIGRYLKSSEVVHHLGEVNDNRPHMLMAFKNNGYHCAFHRWGYYNPKYIIFDGRNFKIKGAYVGTVMDLKETK